MDTVVLVIHLMIAFAIIVLVLLQRSSGGGLGIGGGGGGMGDFATARSTANALTKATTFCAFMFFCTSLTLGVLAKNKSENKEQLFAEETPASITMDAEDLSRDLEGAIQEGIKAAQEAAQEAEGGNEMPAIPGQLE